ncbi:MAG TPA: hypothetical protein DEB31_10290 [Clostridiales bacterium]|nr:hypothetical protein [Clostridiales bacterium]
MKRMLCLLLPALLLLISCGVWTDDGGTEYEKELLMREVDLSPSIVINPVLYFLNSAGTKLEAETRELTVPQDDMREKYVVRALLGGPVSSSLLPVAQGYELQNIELLPDVVNVYLNKEGVRRETELINMKMALAATLSDYTGKTFINVFVNGAQVGYRGVPTGALQKSNDDLSEELNLMQQRAQADSPTLQAVLYFLDSSESLLLPETRRLAFHEKDYITVLVEQMISGPEDAYSHKPVVESTLILRGYNIADNAGGKKTVQLNFNMEPFFGSQKFIDSNRMAVAALTFTICGFMPDVTGIEILVNGRSTGGAVHRISDYQELLGSNLLLYLQSGTTSRVLLGVDRVIAQEQSYHPMVILTELMRGPSAADNISDVESTMPVGVSAEDIADVYIANDIIVLDISKNAKEVMQTVSADTEFVMVFSIVNTLTSIEGIRSVQFLVEGERVEYLREGGVSIIDPIMKNPGIIRYS